ncbi:MAG: hypothetical protein JRD94_01735 [Deltaproteobacteria bacterium]|nr:hypothetical protein [Deltaproteobacteria bacterium]
MTDIWSLPAATLDEQLAKLPSVVTWSRLEPMSLSSDLGPGLQTLMADPLWLIGRQWQFGELRGEEGGTPISAIIDIEHGPLSRLRHGSDDGAGPTVDLLDEAAPLEARVEAEGVGQPSARIRAEAGLHLLRMLNAGGANAARRPVITTWPFAEPAAVDPELPDETGTARAQVYAGRIPDAALVADAIAPFTDGDGPLSALPVELSVPGGVGSTTRTREVLAEWLRWYRRYLLGSNATEAPPSWDPRRLEYSCAVQAELPTGKVLLESEEYTSGKMDWTDFGVGSGDIGATPADRGGGTVRQVTIPSPVEFPGMPADRLWEFEDARVYLGSIDAGPTDLTRMALIEFSLTYGVDWFLNPVDLPAGSVVRVDALRVVDTFGFEVNVTLARQPGGWSMFGLAPSLDTSPNADVFIIPPVIQHVVESDPLEEVALFRDEMANLVWGVERIIQAPSGEPVNRTRAPTVSLRQEVPDDLGDASIVYRLMSPVPDHWAPFVAVPVESGPPGAIELERRPLLHFRSDGTTDISHVKGTLLRTTPDADVLTDRLRVAEEEVLRDGVVVTRRYQLARTPDGGTVLWIGRRKRIGDGEGWSGLRFDTALAPGRV